MKTKKINIIFASFLLLLIPFVFAYSPDWTVRIDAEIETSSFTASGQFLAGADDPAQDDFDNYDGRLVESPSYSIALFTMDGNNYIMADYKESIASLDSKVWQITQRGSRDLRNIGTVSQEILWNLSEVSSTIDLALYDYGGDASRENLIQLINLRNQSSYSFDVTDPYGEYRYFNLVAINLEVPCDENWSCTDWGPTTCPENQTQSRTCIDINQCNTNENKPAQTKLCTYIPLIEPVETCQEDWSCTSWYPNKCPQDQTQTRLCSEINYCGTNDNEPINTQSCVYNSSQSNSQSSSSSRSSHSVSGGTLNCNPNWVCIEWSECIDGLKTRTCTDTNSCDTLDNKPLEGELCEFSTQSGLSLLASSKKTQSEDSINKISKNKTSSKSSSFKIDNKQLPMIIGLVIILFVMLLILIISAVMIKK